MPHIYRRKTELVDLMIDRIKAKRVAIRDRDDGEGGEYVVVINGFAFRAEDPNPAANSSGAMATTLANAINGATVPIEATADGSSILLVPEEGTLDFSLDVHTTDEGGAIIQLSAEPTEYQVKQADNWDGTFTLMETVRASTGKNSATVGTADVGYFIGNKWVRFRFSPADYGLDDTHVLFLRIAPVFGGVPGADRRIIILLSTDYYLENQSSLVLQGEAPIGPIEDAMELVFPRQTTSTVIRNVDDTETAYFSFGAGGGEIPLAPGETFSNNSFGSSDILIRTAEGAANPAEVFIFVALATHPNLK